mgnify:CR=1 FL=1
MLKLITKIKNLIIPALIIALPAFFIFHQPDLGTASILVITGVSILFLAGVKLWKFITAFKAMWVRRFIRTYT